MFIQENAFVSTMKNWDIIISANGFSHGYRQLQAITWANADILQSGY